MTSDAVETALYFSGGTLPLFGTLHEPRGGGGRDAVVFCHAFGEEKLWAHRVFVSFARELAERGHPVFRFDCRGHGDSEGDFGDSSLETNLEDIDAAVTFCKSRTGASRVALLGLRLGATEAALVADRRDDVSALVLWNPVVDGGRYMQELLRVNLTTQLAVHGKVTADRQALVAAMQAGQMVNVDGYDLSWPFYEQVSAIRLMDGPRAFAGPCLIVQADRNPAARPTRDLLALQAQYRQATLTVVQEEPFWKEIPAFCQSAPNLSAATLAFVGAA